MVIIVRVTAKLASAIARGMTRPSMGGSAMDRSAAGSALGVRSVRAQTGSFGPAPGPKPNSLFVLVDELRYPSVFSSSASSVDQFLASLCPTCTRFGSAG
jgi:hypothetical protein